MPQPVIASPNVPSKYQISIAPPRPLTDDPFPLKQGNVLKASGNSRGLILELATGIVQLAQNFELAAPGLINNRQTADTSGLSTLLSSLVRQTSLIMDAVGGDDPLVATMLALQGGFGRLLVNLNQGKKKVPYEYELIDKSVQDVVNAWAAVEKKAQECQPLFQGGNSGGAASTPNPASIVSSLFKPF
jgi:hypothetical protein